MITEGVLSLIFKVISGVINVLPDSVFDMPKWFMDFSKLVSVSLSFFPSDVYYVVIGNISIWIIIHLSWSITEWGYKKLPGVN